MISLSRFSLYQALQSIDTNDNIHSIIETNIILLNDIENYFLSQDSSGFLRYIPSFGELFQIIETNIVTLSSNNNNLHTDSLIRELRSFLRDYEQFNSSTADGTQLDPDRPFDSITRRKFLFFNRYLKILTSFNEKNFPSNIHPTTNNQNYTPVFLSHAYDDRLYTYALYQYFLKQGILLYVDWMHQEKSTNGILLKENLHNSLSSCEQLLFLRSINSELNIAGKYFIRSWCAWELGNFYRNNSAEKYLINLYSCDKYKNLELHGLKLYSGVSHQYLIGSIIH